jgi:hypothetical protein
VATLAFLLVSMYRIYYDDGKTYSGKPFDAPALGVVVIVEKDAEHGRRIVSGGDYFVYRDDRWFAVDFIGMLDYLIQPGAKRVLIGRMISNERWNQIYNAAENDTDFPARTAYGVYEKKLR